MRFPFNNRLAFVLTFICMAGILASSCTISRKSVYFKDLEKDTTLTHLIGKPDETTIVAGDLLAITVSSLSPENTLIYNAAPNSIDGLLGYLVNEDGNIQFIKLGAVKAAGLTKVELSQKLQSDLEPYLGQNVVSVGIQNRHITMMGGITPKVLPLTKNMTLLDALAESGDIGEKGRIDNILVIRSADLGKEKTFKRIDLNDKSIFYSPYFYLQPDDIVYVEPKRQRLQTIQYVSLAMTVVTFIFFTLDRIVRIR